MRVAAVYDIHGNLPALEAVLRELRDEKVDRLIVGGDVIPGPLPRECLEALLTSEIPAQLIQGNGELAVLAQIDARQTGRVEYWGTVSGKPLPEAVQEVLRWSAEQIHPDYTSLIHDWPKTLRLRIDALGDVLFCHGTPRSEVECFTRLTPEEPLRPLFEELGTSLVVCGHTHMQFERMIGSVRVVNAGSIGMPFGRAGADWLLLGPDVQLRHTTYDLAKAADFIRHSSYPQAAPFAETSILHPPSEESMLEAFTRASF